MRDKGAADHDLGGNAADIDAGAADDAALDESDLRALLGGLQRRRHRRAAAADDSYPQPGVRDVLLKARAQPAERFVQDALLRPWGVFLQQPRGSQVLRPPTGTLPGPASARRSPEPRLQGEHRAPWEALCRRGLRRKWPKRKSRFDADALAACPRSPKHGRSHLSYAVPFVPQLAPMSPVIANSCAVEIDPITLTCDA